MDSPYSNSNNITLETRNEQIKGCFLEIYKKFVDEVEPSSIMDWLIQEKIINIEEKERIYSQPTRHEKCRVLLDKLFMTSNKKAFIVLYNVLQENYSWLSDNIDININKLERERQQLLSGNSETSIELSKQLCEALTTVEKLQSELEAKNKKIQDLENCLSNAHIKIRQLQRSSLYNIDNGMICKSPDPTKLNMELNKKDDEIKKLEDHVNILKIQINTFASMNNPNPIDPLDETEKKISNASLLDNEITSKGGSSSISYNDEHFCYGRTENDENQNIIFRKVKLANHSGSYFDLWHGIFGSSNIPVVIKDLLKNPSDIHKKIFTNEIEIVKSLKHSRISNLISYSITSPNLYIIYEGSPLPNVLNKLKQKFYDIPADSIFRWIVQLASGLDYLHSQLIIHRNIFAHNLILCNSYNSVKLSNFSNALKLNTHREIITEETSLRNSVAMVPEVILANTWSLKSDVWLFGMTVIKILFRGRKIFPEMTKRDKKILFAEWSAEQFDKLIVPRLITTTRNTSHVKQCLEYNFNDRPDMSELVSYSKYVGNPIPNFSQKYCFEQTLAHKCSVKGIATLKDMLYIIVQSSSSIKCYKKSNKFERVSSIKLGYKKTRSFPNFLKMPKSSSSSSMDSPLLNYKQVANSSNVLTSLASSERDQFLYVLDGHKDIIFKISAEKRKIISSFEACKGAHNISITTDNTIVVNCKVDDKNLIVEYNNTGLQFRILNTEYINSEPRKAIKLNQVHYLFFHKQKGTGDETFTINIVDNDSIPSSGYGTLCLKNISDVAVHRPSETIFWTDLNGNKVMFVDRYMNCEPQELLNEENGIFNPVKLYITDEGWLFVGLTSGTIRYFQFQWWSGYR